MRLAIILACVATTVFVVANLSEDRAFAAAYGALCGAAIFFAALAPPESRDGAKLIAVMLWFNWLLYVLAWTPYKPAALFPGLLSSKDLWALSDLAIGSIVVLISHRHWWAWAIWWAALVQETLHGLYWGKAFDFTAYSWLLDKVFLAQLSVLFMIGGRGVRDWGNFHLDRMRSGGGLPGSAHARTRRGVRS